MSTTKTLRKWRVVEVIYTTTPHQEEPGGLIDCSCGKTGESVVNNGNTAAIDKEMKEWTVSDADLEKLTFFEDDSDSHFELQVFDGKRWRYIKSFYWKEYCCPCCHDSFHHIVSEEELSEDNSMCDTCKFS